MEKRHYVSEAEIVKLFHAPKRKKKYRVLSLQVARAGFLVVVGIYFLINAPATADQLAYWWENDIKQSEERLSPEPNFFSRNLLTDQTAIDQVIDTDEGAVKNREVQKLKSVDLASSLQPNTIFIPKIKVKAPIVWDVSDGKSVNEDLTQALERGVVRYPQTALPNQVGNVFLAGHSSNYWWEKGDYKTVFALINRLVVGDMVYIKYNNVVYSYKVTSQKVVKPTDTWVLDSTARPTLTLMTCTPTGTALRRRVIIADLISPLENLEKQVGAPTVNSLESVR